MKIAIINQHASAGGWRYLYQLTTAMKRIKPSLEITIFVDDLISLTYKLEDLTKHGIKVEKINIPLSVIKPFKEKKKSKNKHLNKLINCTRKLFYEIKKSKHIILINKQLTSERLDQFDIVFYSWPFEVEALNTKKPLFFIPHDFIFTHSFGFEGIGFYTKARCEASLQSFKTFEELGAHPIVSSHFIADEYNRIFPNSRQKPSIIYLSTLNEFKKSSKQEIKKYLEKNNIKDDYILFASNVMPHKNLINVLGAWYYIKQKHPRLKLIISGYGNDHILGKVNTPYYMDHIYQEDDYDVKSVGLQSDEDFSLLIQGAKIVINASLCEAGNGSGLDAWALGVPVAMSDIPAYKDQLKHLGVKAQLFDPKNSKDIAKAVLTLLSHPEQMKENVRVSQEKIKDYSWEKVAAQYLKVFQQADILYKKNEERTVAVLADFRHPIDLSREGIGIYAKYVMEGLLKNYPNLRLEIWQYAFNTDNMRKTFKELITNYGNRISFFDESMVEKEKKIEKTYYFKLLYYRLLYLFNKKKFKSKKGRLKKRYIEKPDDLSCLQAAFQKLSKAQNIWVPFWDLELGKKLSLPRIVQVHDLYTIPLRDIFLSFFPNIDELNARAIGIINEYAASGAVFATGTPYVAKEQILKYTQAEKDQVKVIPYPPMWHDFSAGNIPSEQAFRKKYNIEGDYLPYPTINRPNKNFAVLLRALKELKEKRIPVKFVTTGLISTVHENEEYVKKHHLEDMIIQTGNMPSEDLYALYKYASLVVVPAIVEGPGMPQQVLEPLKIGGIPVICSKCMGMEESLKNVGLSFQTADLNWFDCDDEKTLVRKITDVLKNRQKHIEKQKNIIQAYTRISWADVAAGYLNIFDSMQEKH